MTPALEAHGFSLAYEERGEGPTALFVHGIGCDRHVWRDVHFEGRAVVYDRRAYGESGAPEPYGATSVEEQAEDAVQLLGEPAVVVGHSLGALVALDLMRRRPELVTSAVVAEPPLLWLLEGGSEGVAELREAVEEGARTEGAAGAVSACMSVLAGPGWEQILGPERAEASKAHARGLLADLAGTANWTATRRELKAIPHPVRVLSGSRTPGRYGEAARALADLLPNAEFEQLDAGWLSPVEAPDALTRSASAGTRP